jgi:hypothetical protein
MGTVVVMAAVVAVVVVAWSFAIIARAVPRS